MRRRMRPASCAVMLPPKAMWLEYVPDADGLARLLAEGVVLEMPPMWNW